MRFTVSEVLCLS